MNGATMEMYVESADFLKTVVPTSLQNPRVAVICGSGLGGLADTVKREPKTEIPYDSIPHFPRSTVAGHDGKLVFGILGNNVPSVLMVGRTHFYEGHSVERITLPIRVFKLLGVQTVIITNAAGGLNAEYRVGDIVALNDHIFLAGLAGIHPLRGANMDEFGPRFPALSDAYDLGLRRTAHQAWKKVAKKGSVRKLHEGVYFFASGPSYETRAECRLLKQLGGDVVGMSTAPEVIVARHCGIKVLAMSLVTNNVISEPGHSGNDPALEKASTKQLEDLSGLGKAEHEEVLQEGRTAALDFQVFCPTAMLLRSQIKALVTQIIIDTFESPDGVKS